MEGWTGDDGGMNRGIDKWMDRQGMDSGMMDRQRDGWMDRGMDGGMDRGMDGGMDRGDGWRDGQR